VTEGEGRKEGEKENGENVNKNIVYVFFIDVGSIPQQNLHNISFSSPSRKV
jgi:hypothetical protein